MGFDNKILQRGINITRLRSSGGGSNWSTNKITIISIEKITQFGIFLRHRDYASKITKKQKIELNRENKKKANIPVLLAKTF